MQRVARDPSSVPVHLVNTPEQLRVLADAIRASDRIAVDTETHNATVHFGVWSALRVVSYAVRTPGPAGPEYQAFVVDFRDVPAHALAPVHRLIEVADGWNAEFDDLVTTLAKVPVPMWRDAMLTDADLHAGVPGFTYYHALAWAAKRYLKVEMSGKGSTQTSFDAESDLTEEQTRYAGHDAVITLWVAETLDEFVRVAAIGTSVQLGQGARPFTAAMGHHGIPFDSEGWVEYLETHKAKQKAALKTLTDLTGGGTVDDTLFGSFVSEEPSWNVESGPDRKKALNEWAPDLVAAFLGGRQFGHADQLDKSALLQMLQLADAGSDQKLKEQARLCQALLDYSKHAKVLQTYSDSILKHVGEDGRMRPKYYQSRTATGRLSSDEPNAQNFSPDMKRFIRTKDGRVFVHADLSQAELRVLAHLSGEEKMIQMFIAGGDFHTNTAAQMFGLDMNELQVKDPHLFSSFRKKAKELNFGIPYGLGASAMAVSLTTKSGVKTETSEAAEMLKTYAQTYTKVDAWLGERDDYIKALAANPPTPDWALTFKLHELWLSGEKVRKAYKRSNGRLPSGVELAEEIQPEPMLRPLLEERLGRTVSDEEVAAERRLQAEALDWAFTFDAPVVLLEDGTPLQFESRTISGRRRLFMVRVDSGPGKEKFAGVLTSAMLLLATTDKPAAAEYRDSFAAQHRLDLPKGVNRCQKRPGEDQKAYRNRSNEHRKTERNRCVKAFEGENKPLKAAFVRGFIEKMGPQAGQMLLMTALGDQIRQMGNQRRNHPIQGSVGDIVLQAFADIWERLKKYEDAYPVQSVHDSVAIECRIEDAQAIAAEVKEALESAMTFWCPSVPAKADCDIRRSMDDDDVLSDEELAALVAA